MLPPHITSLIAIAAVWCIAFRIGMRWTRACGVTGRADALALACVLPTAGLLFAVHVLATISMFTTTGWLTPEGTAFIFAAVTFVAHRRLRTLPRVTPSAHHPSPSTDSHSPWQLGWWWCPVLVVVSMYAVFALEALTRYPANHDALYYHYPQAVVWMQERAIHLINGLTSHSVPENGMIVACLLAFAKLESLFTVVQLPNAALCAILVYALSRFLGAGSKAAIISTCIALSIPIILFQSVSGYIDLYAAVAWLSALLAIGWMSRASAPRARRSLLIMAGLSAGVALGSKTTFVLLVAMLGIIIAAGDWFRIRAGRDTIRTLLTNAAVFTLATLACSGFWFVRGAVYAGNPVYPMAVEIGGVRLLPGIVGDDAFPTRSWSHRIKHWSYYPWRETKYGTGYIYGVDNGLGAAYAAIVPIGLIAAAFAALKRRPRDATETWRVVSLLICLASVILLVTVYCEILRYVLPVAILGISPAALTLDRLMRVCPRSILAVVTASLILTAAVATLKPVHAFLGRAKDDVWTRADYYQIPPLVDEMPPGTRILSLAESTDEYALLGSGFTNRVITPRHWNILTDGAATSNRTLRDHRIEYIFTRHPEPTDCLDKLAIERVFNGAADQPPWMSPNASLYRVRTAPPP